MCRKKFESNKSLSKFCCFHITSSKTAKEGSFFYNGAKFLKIFLNMIVYENGEKSINIIVYEKDPYKFNKVEMVCRVGRNIYTQSHEISKKLKVI